MLARFEQEMTKAVENRNYVFKGFPVSAGKIWSRIR